MKNSGKVLSHWVYDWGPIFSFNYLFKIRVIYGACESLCNGSGGGASILKCKACEGMPWVVSNGTHALRRVILWVKARESMALE